MVCRDCEGNVMVALSQKVELVQSVEMAEALAARRAVVFAREPSFSKCKMKVNVFRSYRLCRIRTAAILYLATL